jgi:hypothetical protein
LVDKIYTAMRFDYKDDVRLLDQVMNVTPLQGAEYLLLVSTKLCTLSGYFYKDFIFCILGD